VHFKTGLHQGKEEVCIRERLSHYLQTQQDGIFCPSRQQGVPHLSRDLRKVGFEDVSTTSLQIYQEEFRGWLQPSRSGQGMLRLQPLG